MFKWMVKFHISGSIEVMDGGEVIFVGRYVRRLSCVLGQCVTDLHAFSDVYDGCAKDR